jgi:hypothetical protein
MKTTTGKTEGFFREAIDTMFKVVGFSGFDKEFAKQSDWYSRRAWTPEQRDNFRRWFIASSRKELKWTKCVAEREFYCFDLMWGWREIESDDRRRS